MASFERMARLVSAVGLLAASLACTAGPVSAASDPPPAEAGQTGDIKHIEPAPDSIGPQPVRFVWSKVDGAESYTLRIWNEADVRVASETGIRTTSAEFPKDADMPAGTYFWSVVAMRGDDAIAESGLAAFVVQKP
jgi:hypothetical protein